MGITPEITLGNRIQNLRAEKGWLQIKLASKIGVSYTQMGRYENHGVQPPADTLKKMADAFGVTADYLINGDDVEKVTAAINDPELLLQFKAIKRLNKEDIETIKKIIGEFIDQKRRPR